MQIRHLQDPECAILAEVQLCPGLRRRCAGEEQQLEQRRRRRRHCCCGCGPRPLPPSHNWSPEPKEGRLRSLECLLACQPKRLERSTRELRGKEGGRHLWQRRGTARTLAAKPPSPRILPQSVYDGTLKQKRSPGTQAPLGPLPPWACPHLPTLVDLR